MVVTTAERNCLTASLHKQASLPSFLDLAHFCNVNPIFDNSKNINGFRRRCKEKLEVFSTLERHRHRVLAEILSDG